MPKKRTSSESKQNYEPVIALLAENFANLQKSFTQLTEKFDNLTGQISSLLRLFEISAKNIAEKPELGFERDFINKLNAILEQNRVIAKAMSIIEERTRQPSPQPVYQPQPMPVQRMQMPQRTMQPAQPEGMMPMPEDYTASPQERRPRPLPQA